MIVVIPSNRSIELKFFEPLIEQGARFIIVDDTEGSITVDHPQFEVYNWGDRRKMLGDLDIGYPKRNGASRDFGFYIAWKESDAGEIIVALDDDCEVYHPDFGTRVEEALSTKERPVVTCEGTHLNILNLYDGVSDQLYPRGFPYASRAEYRGIENGVSDTREVTFSLGMWKSAFDVNAIDKVKGPEFSHPDAELKVPSVIIEKEKLVSVCSMNMQFRKEVIPAAYQLPMHVEVMPGWVVDRYGDIWGGFILKALMDLKGEALAVGEPMINHLKTGDTLRNAWQEHTCHLINDEFVELLLGVKATITPGAYLDMMKELTEGFKEGVEGASPLFKPYLKHLCVALDAWNKSLG